MTREMLLEKSLGDLREIAKTLGVKSLTKYRKAELADIIMNQGRVPDASGSDADPASAPSGEASGQAPDPALAPRRKGRPRKALNDPSPLPSADRNAEQAVPEKPVEAAPEAVPEERRRIYSRDLDRPRQQPDYPRSRGYGQNDQRQQNRNYGNQGRYYDRNEPRYPQNRDYRQNQDYQQPRDYPQYAPQGYPAQDYSRQGYDYPQRYGYDGEGYRQTGYYNAEYGTSNPAVPEMLETGECGDAEGILEVVNEGFGFLRAENYLSGPKDVYISNAQIRRFRLKNGDKVTGKTRPMRDTDKYSALLYITAINDMPPEENIGRRPFEELIPIFPNERLTLESKNAKAGERLTIRLIDLMAPIGKGQRGLIVSQPKAGKTTLLKNIANGITNNYPDVTLIVLLIDERPEEVTDMQRSIKGEVAYSTFDQLPENHTKLAELVQERAMRLVEQGKDVVILLDSITRLARAYNLTITPTGRTLSGGMDPAALYKPKRFFGAARNIENGGSLTVIATALVETGSRMDDMVYEEFKGTGNMEIHLDRKLSERRIFPAVDIYKSGTRRDELLLSPEEMDCATTLRRMLVTGNAADVTEQVIDMLGKSETNEEFIAAVKKLATGYESKGYTTAKAFTKSF